MRKILTITILASLIFTACKKDKAPENTPNDGKKYEVKFNATGFSQEFSDFDPSSVTKGLKTNDILDTTTDAIRLNIFDSQKKKFTRGNFSLQRKPWSVLGNITAGQLQSSIYRHERDLL